MPRSLIFIAWSALVATAACAGTVPPSAALAPSPHAPAPSAVSSPAVAPSDAATDTREPIRVPVERAFWIPGEQMFFAVAMRGFVGIHATIAVGHPGLVKGREVIVVRSQVETSTLVNLVKSYFEEATTYVDMNRATPISRRALEHRDGRETVIESRFADTFVEHTRTRTSERPHSWQRPMPDGEPIYDNQTILGLVRSYTPQTVPTRAYFYAVTDEILHRHELRFSGHETVTTALGTRHTRRYDVDVYAATRAATGERRSDQSYTIWVSDDIARMPVQLFVPHRYGRIEMTLVGYSRPHPNGSGTVLIQAGD